MSRLVRDARLETREARRRLAKRKLPYWRVVIEGIHLGYYKGKNNGAWYAKARNPEGKYIWHTLGLADDFSDSDNKAVLNYSQAQDRAKEYGNKIRHGQDRDESKKYTVNDAIKNYLDDFIANGKKSLYSTKRQIETHISPIFGNHSLANLTYRQLDTWKNELATTEKRLRTGLGKDQRFAPNTDNDPDYQRRRRATANRIITILKAILNYALKIDRIKSNDSWKKLKPFRNVSSARIRFLSKDETDKLLKNCPPDLQALVRSALLTGARYGELTQLAVSDYNPLTQSIFIRQSKSGKPRSIPLNTQGVQLFGQLTIGKNLDTLIFTRDNGFKWGKNHQVRPITHACQAAEIAPLISFHHLRHTYASTLAMKGVPLQVIAELLGHTDTRITHKHYAHLMPSYVADVVKSHLPNFGKIENNNVVQMPKRTRKSA